MFPPKDDSIKANKISSNDSLSKTREQAVLQTMKQYKLKLLIYCNWDKQGIVIVYKKLINI